MRIFPQYEPKDDGNLLFCKPLEPYFLARSNLLVSAKATYKLLGYQKWVLAARKGMQMLS